MIDKLLVITPHLSTGGAPQYTLTYLQENKSKYATIKVVEFTCFSMDFTIQRKQIIDLIGENNFISLGVFGEPEEEYIRNREPLIPFIEEYSPNEIWMAECPEGYEYRLPPKKIMDWLYRENRPYTIFETTHYNAFDFSKKIYIPDRFMFCSEVHLKSSALLDIPKTVWEYPIYLHDRPNREETLQILGLDPTKYHVLNVGLINSNKNQKYIFSLAQKYIGQPIQFHFIGNDCFLDESGITQEEWESPNCYYWGERSDVDVFMSCMDMYLFPSKKELNPLTIKEALSWQMEVFAQEDAYTTQYTSYSNFHIITKDNVASWIEKELKERKPLTILVNIPNCEIEKYKKQQQECEKTWIPWMREQGIRVIISIAKPDLSTEYELHGDELWCKCTDELNINFVKKRFFFLKWAATQTFNYVLLTSTDVFVHVDRFINMIQSYVSDSRIVVSGAVNPFLGWNPNKNIQTFCGKDLKEWEDLIVAGCGMILSRIGVEEILCNFDIKKADETKYWDDVFFSTAIKEAGFSLHFDSRVTVSSPFGYDKEDVFNLGESYIKEYNSHLAIQHPLDGHLEEVYEYVRNPRKFLIVCSFYNNTKEHVQRTFDNVIKQTYPHWLFIVTDDFSTNECKQWVLEEIQRRNHPNIVYYTQKHKREIYLYQNLFPAVTYDYYFDLDADDIIDDALLETYEYYFCMYPEAFSLFSDFTCINEQGELQRFGAIQPLNTIDDFKSAFNLRTHHTGDEITLQSYSWSMYGLGRCFRKIPKLKKFPIKYVGKTATDSFLLFTTLHYGPHLHIPKNLYTWVLREGSDSGKMTSEEYDHYNDNTKLAISKACYGGIDIYSELYLYTTALIICPFVKKVKELSIIGDIKHNLIGPLLKIYEDKTLYFNKFTNYCIIIWNELTEKRKNEVLLYLKENSEIQFCIYYLHPFDSKEIESSMIQEIINQAHKNIIKRVSEHLVFRYFLYYRHLILQNP